MLYTHVTGKMVIYPTTTYYKIHWIIGKLYWFCSTKLDGWWYAGSELETIGFPYSTEWRECGFLGQDTRKKK